MPNRVSVCTHTRARLLPHRITHSLYLQNAMNKLCNNIFIFSFSILATIYVCSVLCTFTSLESLVKCECCEYEDDSRKKNKTDWNRMCHFLDVLCLVFIFLGPLVVSASCPLSLSSFLCNARLTQLTDHFTDIVEHLWMCIGRNRRRVQVHTELHFKQLQVINNNIIALYACRILTCLLFFFDAF